MAFCQQYGLRIPILQAPMAGTCPVSLAVAVADAGGMDAMGALLSSPDAIANWAAEFRSRILPWGYVPAAPAVPGTCRTWLGPAAIEGCPSG